METKEVAYTAAIELAETLKKIDQKQIDQLATSIKQAKRIFVSGSWPLPLVNAEGVGDAFDASGV